ncbi:hypothetical protein D1872_296610 [compost metagenome]
MARLADRFVRLLIRHRPHPFAAKNPVTLPKDDRLEPARERLGGLQPVQVEECLGKGFLHRILRQLAVFQFPVGNRLRHGRIMPDNRRKSLLVPLSGLLYIF